MKFFVYFLAGLLPLSAASVTPDASTNTPASVAPVPAPPPAATVPEAIDPFSDPLIRQVQVRHERAVKGDTSETKKLTADLEKWTKQHPDNHLLQAYLGSAYTLCSRDAWPGPGKLRYLRQGGTTLDAAVAAAPDNPAVRFVRAIDYFELPSIFGKRGTARSDFQTLVQQVEGVAKNPYKLNAETRQAIYYYAGLSYQQLWEPAQARAVWGRGAQIDPHSALGVKMIAARGRLK